MVPQGAGAGVGGDQRTGGQLQDMGDAAVSQVGDVEEHAEAFHLAQRLDAGGGQAAAGGVLPAAVGERRTSPVGDRGDAYAEPVQGGEQFDGGVDARRALQGEDEGDPAGGEGPVDVRTVAAQGDVVGVGLGDDVAALDHAEGLPQRSFGAVLLVDEHRQDLDVDAALAQLRKPPLPEEAAPPLRGPGGDGHEEVVVGIGDDGAVVEAQRHDGTFRVAGSGGAPADDAGVRDTTYARRSPGILVQQDKAAGRCLDMRTSPGRGAVFRVANHHPLHPCGLFGHHRTYAEGDTHATQDKRCCDPGIHGLLDDGSGRVGGVVGVRRAHRVTAVRRQAPPEGAQGTARSPAPRGSA